VTCPTPEEVVRLVFEARTAGNVRRVLALLDPDVRATLGPGDDEPVHGVSAARQYLARESARGRRIEIDAHRLERDGDEGVRVVGRIRVIDGGSLSDSPAAWHFTVRGGRVVAIVPLAAEQPALQHVA
jgi:ketosteroid isomerase-like protein